MIHDWARKWGVPQEAIADLCNRSNPTGAAAHESTAASETGAQIEVRLEAARMGAILWRNNVGCLPGPNGQPVRYGLANDSAVVNKRTKSCDLIGVRPVVITPEMVGHTIGQFLAREIKEPGWKYTGRGREPAQANFINLVNIMGGNAAFATGRGSL